MTMSFIERLDHTDRLARFSHEQALEALTDLLGPKGFGPGDLEKILQAFEETGLAFVRERSEAEVLIEVCRFTVEEAQEKADRGASPMEYSSKLFEMRETIRLFIADATADEIEDVKILSELATRRVKRRRA